MMGCAKCKAMCSWVMIILGAIFLLNSYGIFFNFQASEWGIVLLVFGICTLMGSNCPECKAMTSTRKK